MSEHLTDEQVERDARQLVLPQWSEAAQLALGAARVLVVGLGALGSPVALYLAAAGVGRIGLVDDDRVERSNLARQLLHGDEDVGRSKVASAVDTLRALHPHVVLEPHELRIAEENAAALVAGHDLVVDCSDSFETRYLVNDACCRAGVALVEAGVLGFDGLVLSIRPGSSACYRCAFPLAPPAAVARSCAEGGVLGAVAGVIGSLQALEALKLLSGVGTPATDTLLAVDGLDLTVTRVRLQRRADCPACGPAHPRSSTL
jgi:molybdopterin/thiamine biosynthesis adenylyltransferase